MNNGRTKRVHQSAFTLIEIMIAVVILGVLAALTGPGILNRIRKLSVSTTKSTLSNLKTAIVDYNQDMGHFPTKQEGGLEAIVKRPQTKGAEKWDGPYLSGKTEVPRDGWDNDIEYNVGANIKNKDRYKYFELISYGADGQPGGKGVDAELYEGE